MGDGMWNERECLSCNGDGYVEWRSIDGLEREPCVFCGGDGVRREAGGEEGRDDADERP